MGRICPRDGGIHGSTRRSNMKQKIGILIFITFGLALWYLIFTNEGQEMGSDFAAWVEEVTKF
jgi:hypothetical protein